MSAMPSRDLGGAMKENMREQIFVIESERSEVLFVDKEAFEIRPDRGYLWLQRAAFWLLRKIGAFRTGMDVKFTQHRIDERDFIGRLYKSKRAVLDRMAHDPGTLLIGADDWRELMGGARIQSMFQFSSSIDWHDRNGPRVIGMKVVIVPWMSGILPVPDSIVGNGK